MADPPLAGLRVLDVATIYAGPLAAMLLGDFGAEVIKIEHPQGDPLRNHGHSKNGHGLWWKVVSRNKLAVTLDLSRPEGQEILCQLVRQSDVLIESFRPGVMERWNLAPDRLRAANPGLVMLRVSGFGQFGPYAKRPGFGTLAEAMSGFAHITGLPDGPPTLPPFGLADGIAGVSGAFAVLLALYNRDKQRGQGQVIDLAIIEPIFSVLGSQPTVYDQLGIIQQRTGNRSLNNAPRNTYQTRDARWVAISTSTNSVAERVMKLIGHPELIDEPWFKSPVQRAQHAELLDRLVGRWIADRGLDEVLREFIDAGAAIAPIYDVADAMGDPQFQALNTVITVQDDDLGPLKMQNVMFRLLDTPGRVRFAGRRLGQDNQDVYGRLGISTERLARLRDAGVV